MIHNIVSNWQQDKILFFAVTMKRAFNAILQNIEYLAQKLLSYEN